MQKSPYQSYSDIQSFVQQDINQVIKNSQQKEQYEVVKVQAHTHNGSDSQPVAFSDLDEVQYHSLIKNTTLTPNQVKALFTTPITIVPQPGIKGVIIVDGITVRIVYSGTAYTGTHNMEFHYTDGNGQQVTDSVPASFINSTSSTFYYATPTSSSFVPVEGGSGNNGRIVAFVNTANPATGNSQIIISVKYHLCSFNI